MNSLTQNVPRIVSFVFLCFIFESLGEVEAEAHKLDSSQAVLTVTPDLVWILELEINLTRYIQSNPDLAETARPTFRSLENEGVFSEQNFNDWETVFSVSEQQFRKELQIIRDSKR